VLETCRGMQ